MQGNFDMWQAKKAFRGRKVKRMSARAARRDDPPTAYKNATSQNRANVV
jgi:hypothetical protein